MISLGGGFRKKLRRIGRTTEGEVSNLARPVNQALYASQALAAAERGGLTLWFLEIDGGKVAYELGIVYGDSGEFSFRTRPAGVCGEGYTARQLLYELRRWMKTKARLTRTGAGVEEDCYFRKPPGIRKDPAYA